MKNNSKVLLGLASVCLVVFTSTLAQAQAVDTQTTAVVPAGSTISLNNDGTASTTTQMTPAEKAKMVGSLKTSSSSSLDK